MWRRAIFALCVATAFIYFLIFNPELSGKWLAENMTLSWTMLGIAMGSFGAFVLIKSKSHQHSTYHRIRGAAYSIIGVSILVTIILS